MRGSACSSSWGFGPQPRRRLTPSTWDICHSNGLVPSVSGNFSRAEPRHRAYPSAERETAYGFSSPVSYPSDYFISSQARLHGLGGIHLSVTNTVLDYGLFALIIREDFLLTGSQTAATWFGTHCSTG